VGVERGDEALHGRAYFVGLLHAGYHASRRKWLRRQRESFV
jgi:hypothetical protein